MPTQFPVLPFRIGCHIPTLYYETTQQRANVAAEKNLHERISEILGIHIEPLKKNDEIQDEELQNYILKEKDDHNQRKKRKIGDRQKIYSRRTVDPMDGCTEEEYAKIIQMLYQSEYKRNMPQFETKLPAINTKYNTLNKLDEKQPPRYEMQTQLWQSAPHETWDLVQSRDPVTKPKHLSTLPDAKKTLKCIYNRKYPKDSEYIPVDQQLLDLIHEDKLRPELSKPYPGYTGANVQYFQWDSPADRIKRNDAYNSDVYKSTTKLVHRPFPQCEYEKRVEQKRKGDLSRAVSVLYPFHPFQNPPKLIGEWKTNLNLQQW